MMISGSDVPDAENPGQSGDVAALSPAEFDWTSDAEERDPDTLIVDIEGFEGPLDLLLVLARKQKVDLTKISVLALAQQYLDFIAQARQLRLELAADYLVMAAWLTYLKSKLLLPDEEDEEEGPSGDELAARLAFRLKRLEAMRGAAAQLMNRRRLGRDIFARGQPEGVRVIRTPEYKAEVYDLLKCYSEQRQRNAVTSITMQQRSTWSIADARERLERLLGISIDWFPLAEFLVEFLDVPEERRSLIASTFGATLEMTREGELELKQAKAFAPLYLRWREKVRP
ncbi:segregation and condensation protein A [bacterium MnTg02]|nr:segregation and condensation protein A [bacterium MnTg02]